MPKKLDNHTVAVLQALLVTFLWSTSWVLIKIGLHEIPALTFAGLRYSLASLCLLPLFLHSKQRKALGRLQRADWLKLVLLGVLFYALTQGAQFVGLAYMPALTVSLLLNFTSLIVALFGIPLLAEIPSRTQWAGMLVFLGGVLLYFYPVQIPAAQWVGLAAVTAGVIANALSAILGRDLNRREEMQPLLVTTLSMSIGSVLLLASGITLQGLPPLGLLDWAIILWLAVINTAFAFTIWNHTLRTLSAMESSIINGTMLAQIAILAWIFLGESLNAQKIVGILLAGAGALVVQLRRARQAQPAHPAFTTQSGPKG